MSDFIQLHVLTAYPPANLNRDDLGRPKTAIMGGAKRLRVSSQSLKRTWRTSDVFQTAMGENRGTRTKRLGAHVQQRLVDAGIDEKKARAWANQIAGVFGDVQKDQVETRQLVHVAPEEWQAVDALADTLAAEKRAPEKEELDLLRARPRAVDIALFGRMLAASPKYNVDAACQVAHAITVHAAEVEDDYFTAVDDLNPGDEDRGAGHIGEFGFGAGLFYSYICIDRQQLIENLAGDADLADRGVAALVEAITKTSPKGKQNSFGSRARAVYTLAERGDEQPRSLSVAFMRPVSGEDFGIEAIQRIEAQAQRFDDVYEAGADGRYAFCTLEAGDPKLSLLDSYGTLGGLLDFVTGDRA